MLPQKSEHQIVLLEYSIKNILRVFLFQSNCVEMYSAETKCRLNEYISMQMQWKIRGNNCRWAQVNWDSSSKIRMSSKIVSLVFLDDPKNLKNICLNFISVLFWHRSSLILPIFQYSNNWGKLTQVLFCFQKKAIHMFTITYHSCGTSPTPWV